MTNIISENRVIVMLGAGGVGKTTTSILVALNAARCGKKVGLISVDPAKRLADALGIPLQSELKKISVPLDVENKGGQIWAAMIDQKTTLEALIKKFAKTEKSRETIYENVIYKNAADKIGGALEYLAIAKLGELLGEDYDTIIVDTPPDLHALDFLVRPGFLTRFIENKVMRWLIKPIYYTQKFNVRLFENNFIQKVTQLTGLNLLKEIAAFFVHMQDTIFGLHEMSMKAQKSIQKGDSAIVFVATPSDRVMRSLKYVHKELLDLDMKLSSLILNRCLPDGTKDALLRLDIPGGTDLHNLKTRSLGEDRFKTTARQFLSLPVNTLTESISPMNDWASLQQLADELCPDTGIHP